MFEQLAPLTPLSSEIRRCILSEDEISDDASPALRQVRRNMKVTNDRIHTQLSGLVSGNAPPLYLSSGFCDHHEKRPVLYSCQSRI